MRQLVTTRRGGPDALVVRDVPAPAPSPGEVRVRTALAGLNFADVMVRLGLYPDGPALPAVLGHEASGEIDAVGDGVPVSRIGERVVALCRFGAFSEQVCVPAAQAFALPAGIDLERAAALPVNYLTAHVMLRVLAPVQPGDRVLVHSAAGGVGQAACQLARLGGGEVLASASPAKHDLLRAQGCRLVFDSRAASFAALVKEATEGRGCDIALEPRHGRWIMESYRALGEGGRLILHGFSSAAEGGGGVAGAIRTLARVPWLTLNPLRLMNDTRSVGGVNLGRLWHRADRLVAWMHVLLGWLSAGDIAPVVDRIFTPEEAAAAYRRLEERRNVGKVLLDFRAGGAA
ncbi:MAG TPA: zinc-binding dehydrogenase [Candidatus Krumholzibacteria bacterium]|nr:zinc-binding dehydrogenase [Candidatus Krumholzibacteria bacterium]HPD72370.1 zinc-binding dehydrogenase [Candidatus Krumholzibacteria bacterium]HRY40698.1 zinc-binding dehydrogenase [Candidatus Krumholzibacteria bacterium]